MKPGTGKSPATAGGAFGHPEGQARFLDGHPREEPQLHDRGGGGEKVGAVLPVWLRVATQAEPRLMHQGGGLERVAGGFTAGGKAV
jgi:hypothetical protein